MSTTILSSIKQLISFFKKDKEKKTNEEECKHKLNHFESNLLRKLISLAPPESMIYSCSNIEPAIEMLISYYESQRKG